MAKKTEYKHIPLSVNTQRKARRKRCTIIYIGKQIYMSQDIYICLFLVQIYINEQLYI